MEFKSNIDDIENRFSMLLKSIPIPALIWKKMYNSLTLVNSNEESYRISRGKIKEYIGRKASEIYKNNSQLLKVMQECALNNHKLNLTTNNGNPIVNNGNSYNTSFELIAPDTIVQYFTTNSSVNKKILKNDISKKNGKQNRLIQQATLDSIYKAAPIGIGMVVNRNFVHVNHRFCDLVGYDREELINKNARVIYPTDEEYEYVGKEKYDQINKYGIGTVETQFRRKDGKIIQILLSSAYVDPKNPLLGATFTALDITKRRIIEKELINREKRFQDFVNLLPLVVFETDALGNLSSVNEKGFEIFGYSPEDIENGVNSLQLIIPPDRRKALRNTATNLIEEDISGVEYLAQKKNGDIFPVLVYTHPIIYDEKPIGFRGILIDITERKNREIKLKESEEKYRILSENSDDLISLYDEKFRMTYINAESHSRVLGYPAKKFLKASFKNIIAHKDDVITLINIIKKGIKEGSYRGQIRFKHQEGYYLWFQLTAKFFSVESENRKLLVIARDITDIKQFEENLRESEEKYRFLTENSDDLITLYNDKIVADYINTETHSRVLGYPPEKFLKKSFKGKITHKDDIIPYLESFKEGSKSGNYLTQVRFKHKEGYYLWFQIYAKFFNDILNKRKLLVVARNITDIKQAEKNLKESEEKFRIIAEQAFMGIMIMQDDKLKYVNSALLDIFGFSSKDTEGWTKEDITRLVHPEDLDFLRVYRRNLKEGVLGIKNYNSYRVFTKNGKLKWIDQFSKNIIFKGESAELITIIDVTEKKEAEEELIKLNNLKSELFVRTSHELKTPLVSIKGFSDLLLTVHKSKLDDYSISKITAIKNGADRLQKLIGDILKAAELESGYTKIKLNFDNLSQLIIVCIREVQGFADLRNHELEINIQQKLIANFEQEQIHKVISNLLHNAIKYTPPDGKIEIRSEIRDNLIITSVKDNGIGFTSEEKEMIFKQFGKIERYGQNLEVVPDGTGLGLFISKKIIELHGGEIWAESEGRNQGSTFYFTLPLTQRQ
ncbi:MAG: PAS domain S-box protein [Candidatus Lokiarchaeota archaeon]|nr:PAS domain S-box protein [Candidatus Lokiarchaeota archaeon]